MTATMAADPVRTTAVRSHGYLALFLGSVVIMDGYVSAIRSSAIPHILGGYGIDATVSGLGPSH